VAGDSSRIEPEVLNQRLNRLTEAQDTINALRDAVFGVRNGADYRTWSLADPARQFAAALEAKVADIDERLRQASETVATYRDNLVRYGQESVATDENVAATLSTLAQKVDVGQRERLTYAEQEARRIDAEYGGHPASTGASTSTTASGPSTTQPSAGSPTIA